MPLAVLARFAARDHKVRLLASYLQRWGRPLEFYTDKDSMFTVNRPLKEAEQLAEALTPMRQALRKLGIGWVPAHSPQAKGRRRFSGQHDHW